MSETEQLEVPSPCIRNCCLDQNDICVGCARSIDEILLWGNANSEIRKKILEQVAHRKLGKHKRA